MKIVMLQVCQKHNKLMELILSIMTYKRIVVYLKYMDYKVWNMCTVQV